MAKKKSTPSKKPQKSKELKILKEIVHILGIFTLFVGPLIVYFVRDENEIRDETKRVLNWQFSLLIYLAVATVLQSSVFMMMDFINLHNLLMILNIVLSIIGFVKSTNNEKWEYPLAIKFF